MPAETTDAGGKAQLTESAFAAHREGNLTKAEEQYRALLRLEPDNSTVLLNLISILSNTDRADEALAAWRQFQAIAPDSQDGLFTLTNILMHKQDASGCEAEIRHAVAGYERMLAQDGAQDAARINLSSLVTRYYPAFAEEYRPVVLSTVGHAGTYFTFHFFEFLERRLRPYSKDWDPVPDGAFQTLKAFPNLRMLKLTIHSICPGFEESYHGPHRTAWDRLAAEGEVERVPEGLKPWLDPAANPRARLVFVHRNPFDWTVTLFRSKLRSPQKGGAPVTLSGEASGTEMKRCVAQYFSFRHMAEQFPDRVRLLAFEELVKDPKRVFPSLLEFFGVPPVSVDLVYSSIKSSSPEALMRAEDRTGRATGPSGAPTTHFDRDRKAREQVVLSEQDRATIAGLYGSLGISLSEFGIGA